MSIRPFAERVAAKLGHVSAGFQNRADAYVGDPVEKAKLEEIALNFQEIEKLILEEADGWEKSRPSAAEAAPAISAGALMGVVGSFVAGLVQLAGVATVRGVLSEIVKSDVLWENLRRLEDGPDLVPRERPRADGGGA